MDTPVILFITVVAFFCIIGFFAAVYRLVKHKELSMLMYAICNLSLAIFIIWGLHAQCGNLPVFTCY